MMTTMNPLPAAEYLFKPVLSERIELDDNRRLSLQEDTENVGSITTAGFDGEINTERTRIRLMPRFILRRYAREKDILDREDFRFDSEAEHETERMRFGVEAGIEFRGSVTSVTEELDVPTDTRRNVDQRKRRIQPSWTYAWSERTALQLDLSYQDTVNDEVETTSLSDYRVYSASAGATHNLSERDQISLTAFVSRFESPSQTRRRTQTDGALEAETRSRRESTTDTLGAQLGYARALTETLSGNVSAGPRFSDTRSQSRVEQDQFLVAPGLGRILVSQTDTGTVSMDETSTGLAINAGLSQALERTDWEVSFTRSLSPTADGDLQERDRFDARFRYKLRRHLVGSLNGIYYTDSDLGGEDNDRTYSRLLAGLRWRLDRDWTLSGFYRYRRNERERNDAAAESNALLITLSYRSRTGL